jgi:hypothetical protein
MVEFTSEPKKTFPLVRVFIAVGVLAILIGGTALYVHYQRGAQNQPGTQATTVPGLLRPGNTHFEYYTTRIRIDNINAALWTSFGKARVATISGIIVNDGDRTLEALELHITLYDMEGKVTKERTAFALRPGAGLNAKPMSPLEKRSFTIGIESVDAKWNPKQISYEITGLKYH